MGLSRKHQAFANEYLDCFNATEAYMRVYAPKNRDVAAANAARLLGNARVAEEIDRRLSEDAMRPAEVLKRLAAHARGNMGDFVRFNDNADPVFDLQAASMMGKLHLAKKLKTKTRSWQEPTFNVTSGEIESREVTETAIEFELYDAQAALVQLGKAHGLFVDKSDVTLHGELTFTADEAAQAQTELDTWNPKNSSGEKSSG